MDSKFFGFKTTFLTIGALHMLLAGLMFAQGIVQSMSQFGIPNAVLHSPHYYDAMLYVFYHQFVNGAVLVVVVWLKGATLPLGERRPSIDP